MKLTASDQKYLKSIGVTEDDFWQIGRAMDKLNTTYEVVAPDGDKGSRVDPISREEAIRLLGRKVYLSGIVRSAFHLTASREAKDGRSILFDSSGLFKHAQK